MGLEYKNMYNYICVIMHTLTLETPPMASLGRYASPRQLVFGYDSVLVVGFSYGCSGIQLMLLKDRFRSRCAFPPKQASPIPFASGHAAFVAVVDHLRKTWSFGRSDTPWQNLSFLDSAAPHAPSRQLPRPLQPPVERSRK